MPKLADQFQNTGDARPTQDVAAKRAVRYDFDDPGAAENGKVLRGIRLEQAERLRHFADGAPFFGQQGYHPQSRRMCKGLEQRDRKGKGIVVYLSWFYL